MNYLHRREDITPGIREGYRCVYRNRRYRCVYRIGGRDCGTSSSSSSLETPHHFNTTLTSSAQSDDDVDANANDSQDLVGGGGRVLEIEAPPLPPSQELSLDDILSNELEGHYDIASYSPFTNVNSPRLSDTPSSSSDLADALPRLDESSPLNGHPFDNTTSLAGESIFPSYSAFDLDAALPLVRCDFLTQVPNFEGVFGLAFLVVLVLGNFFSRGYSTAQEAVEESTEHICCQGACTCNTSASPSQDSSPPSTSVESSSSPSRYEKDQQVIYTSGGVSTVATVKVVHLDDTLVPYYTILVDGREKQTDGEHLSPFVGGSWMVSEEIMIILLLISNINLTRSLLLLRTLLLRTVRH